MRSSTISLRALVLAAGFAAAAFTLPASAESPTRSGAQQFETQRMAGGGHEGWGDGPRHRGHGRHQMGHMGPEGPRGPDGQMGRRGLGGGLLDFRCGERAGERLEIGLVRLSHRLELTDAQRPLFEQMKTAALAAQAEFAAACATAQPGTATDGQDPVTRLRALQSVERAHADAIDAVLPALESFYGSLGAEQQAALSGPRSGRRGLGAPVEQAPGASPDGETLPTEPEGGAPQQGLSRT